MSVTGYHLYVGVSSGHYSQTNDVGKVTSANVSDLDPGTTYFFAVSAYDALKLESVLSSEISYTVTPVFVQNAILRPSALLSFPSGCSTPQLQLTLNAQSQAVLTGTGPAGYGYDLLVSTDLRNWSVLTHLTMSPGGACRFIEPGIFWSNTPSRYYRLLPTPVHPVKPRSPATPEAQSSTADLGSSTVFGF